VNQFSEPGNPYQGVGNPYPAAYDFDNRNKSCSGMNDPGRQTEPLVFLDDCIAFCNPFGYEANEEVCGCTAGTTSCTGTTHTSMMRVLRQY
jgi:hypothetical protein